MTAVLVGIEEAAGFDACSCEGYVGTSAGSIVAAALTAGIEPLSRLGKLPRANWRRSGGIGLLSRSLAAVEALALQRRGAHVMTVSPDTASRVAMGANMMDSGPRSRVIAAGLSQGRALGRRDTQRSSGTSNS